MPKSLSLPLVLFVFGVCGAALMRNGDAAVRQRALRAAAPPSWSSSLDAHEAARLFALVRAALELGGHDVRAGAWTLDTADADPLGSVVQQRLVRSWLRAAGAPVTATEPVHLVELQWERLLPVADGAFVQGRAPGLALWLRATAQGALAKVEIANEPGR